MGKLAVNQRRITAVDHPTQNHDLYQWIATGTITALTGVAAFVLKSFGLRLTKVETMSNDLTARIASIDTLLRNVHESVSRRDAQAHEGYQRLARLEEIAHANQEDIRQGRSELRELHDTIISRLQLPPNDHRLPR